MMKIGWSLCSRIYALCVQLLRAKYKCGNDLIPQDVCNLIRATPPPNWARGGDSLAWSASTYGCFSVAGAYATLISQSNSSLEFLFQVIWV